MREKEERRERIVREKVEDPIGGRALGPLGSRGFREKDKEKRERKKRTRDKNLSIWSTDVYDISLKIK